MFFALIFGFPAAYITFHYAKLWLNTPSIANALGAFLVWASVFMFGGVIEAAGSQRPNLVTITSEEAFVSSLKFLALAVFNYVFFYLMQRALIKRQVSRGDREAQQ